MFTEPTPAQPAKRLNRKPLGENKYEKASISSTKIHLCPN
jgi:hypothetical protein